MKLTTRDAVLNYIVKYACRNRLGLMIGAGFSKELCGLSAKGWWELIDSAAGYVVGSYWEFSTDKAFLELSIPERCSRLCREESWDDEADIEELLKLEICRITNWAPDTDKAERVCSVIPRVCPSWIATTNYDSVIEKALGPLIHLISPRQPVPFNKLQVPLFHLHGHRLDWRSLVVTQEDYLRFFWPGHYHQAKLAMYFTESLTLAIGYGAADINILVAHEQAEQFKGMDKPDLLEPALIQLNWVDSGKPKEKPYYQGKLLILDVVNVIEILEELAERCDLKKKDEEKDTAFIAGLALWDNEVIGRFVSDNDSEERKRFIELIQKEKFSRVALIKIFPAITSAWKEYCGVNGMFERYGDWLSFLIDIFSVWPKCWEDRVTFSLLLDSLAELAPYVGKGHGDSWVAQSVWDIRKSQVDPELIAKIITYFPVGDGNAGQKYEALLKLLKS
jgi:hypothetical protein